MALPPIPPRILIADDEPVVVEVLGPRLLRSGYQVLKAADGAMALELSQLLMPSLLLLDHQMPEMKGLEVCARMAQDPATQNIPIVMVTGCTLEGVLPPNVRKVIEKPFSIRAVFDVIQELVPAPVAA